MRTLAILAALALLTMAGCSDEKTTTGPEEPEEPQTGGNNTTQVSEITGTVSASVGVPGVVSFQSGAAALEFTVGPNATLIHIELEWDSAALDLDLHAKEPGSDATTWQHSAEGGGPGSPDSPHNLTIAMGEAGTWEGAWTAGIFANGAASNVNYRIVASVFHGETALPEGYTALV
jgi:hypothetical protein